jgi:signal transduction histidine kinase
VWRDRVRRIVAGNHQGDEHVTTIGTGPTWLDRLNPRNWTLVWKLVVVGLAPALLALSLGALRIADQAGSAAALGDDARLFDLRTQVATVGDAVRAEGAQAALYVAAGRGGDRGGLDAATAKTDAAVGSLRGATSAATPVLDAAAATASSQALNGLGKLATLRTQVTGNRAAAPAQINGTYGQVAEGVDVLDRVLLREIRIPATAGLVDALTAANTVGSQLATQHSLIAAAIRAPGFNPGDREAVAATDVQIFAQYRAYQLALTPEQLQKYGTFLDDPANVRRQQLAADALKGGQNGPGAQPLTVSAADWDAAYTDSRAALQKSAGLLRQDISAAGTAAEQRASNQAGINSVVLMLGLLIGIAIAFLVARSLIRSLRVLRSAALDVAERRLPLAVESMRAGETPDVTVDPVPIGTRDEVGQVARAFDAVHGQAVRLAADQAALQSNVSAMFVNLSRRSQALVERQLQLIEQLESNEQDADQLSNLFQLDHLATRMRRNSENLLVLAGTDLAKRNVAPVPMVDVLRAAVSEVEQYQRVVVQAPPTLSIAGRAGSDLVHLLAELLDNATNFSPPDSQVVMSTTRTPDGSIMVEIADRGVGMADHELSDANQRLSGPSTVDVSASRRMGLFVVGRLAARHGIGVQLAGSGNGPASGLTASVIVPGSLVPTAVPADLGRPIGRPVPAAVPAQARPAERAASETNGSRGPSALVSRPAETSSEAPATGTGPVSRPAANGTVNGLPSRTPGSSLRPTGPTDPPKDPGGRGYFDDGSGEPMERPDTDRARSVAEQARLDQEAAARRDRLRQAAAGRSAAAEHVATAGETDESTARPLGNRPDRAEDDRPDTSVAGTDRRPAGGPPADRGSARRDAAARGEEQQGPAGRDAHRDQDRIVSLGKTPDRSDAVQKDRPDSGTDVERDGDSRPGQARPGVDDTGSRPAAPPRRDERRPAPAPADGPASGRSGSVPPADERPVPPRPTVPPAPLTAPLPVVGASGTSRPDENRVRPSAPQADGVGSRVQDEGDPNQDVSASDATDRAARAGLDAPARPGDAAGGAAQPAAGPGPAPAPFSDGPAAPFGSQATDAAAPRPGPRPEPSRPATYDELFAPSVPGLDDAGSRPGGVNRAFDLGETTPIFEEIASAWFRSNRPIPVSWEEDGPATEAPAAQAPGTPPPPAAARPPAPQQPDAPRSSEGSRPFESPRPFEAPRPFEPPAQADMPRPFEGPRPGGQDRPAPVAPAAPAMRPEPATEPAPEPATADVSAFATAADEGWRAASGAETERPDEITAAGLPKRRPRARLVPGSAGSAVLSRPAAAPRSAEDIRGRLSSYQQGVRQGRETRLRGASGEHPAQPDPTADGDPES